MKKCLLLLLFFTIACKSNTKNKKLNLIFILTDQQRFDTSAPYGNREIKTPNLNKLAKQSIVFERAYVTQPVCSPSRSSILTGLYPHKTGVTFNNIDLADSVKTLPEIIHNRSYHAGYIGKWHLGDELQAVHGFDTRISTEDIYNAEDPTHFSDYYDYLKSKGYNPDNKKYNYFSREFISTLPFGDSRSKFIENRAIDFIRQNKKDPFILYLGFLNPHPPINGPFNKVHNLRYIPLNPAHFSSPSKDEPWRLRIKAANNNDITPQKILERIQKYWGLVHQVDLSVGNILKEVKKAGLNDNTIIVYTSEHGSMLGEHHILGKTVMYESSIRVPLFISAPGLKSRKIPGAVSQIDLVPTLLDLMKVNIPGYLQGKSLLPLMKGKSPQHDPVVIEWNRYNYTPDKIPCIPALTKDECKDYLYRGEYRAIIKNKWKLNMSVNNLDKSQLFNLNKDPFEFKNLYYNKAYKNKIQKLKSALKTWQVAVNDTVNF